ncbi:hypothetical protein BC826DRAFT_505632 [Russula brevipes]|nr:hypothetical protein BC826DRAFT_505632 [Russula brevipes]
MPSRMSPHKMSLTPIGAPPEAEDSATVGHSIYRQCKTQEKRERVTINTLPDDALREIFDFYRRCPHSYAACCFTSNTCTMKVWKPLLDVCRRWRYVIFESSRRLHLRLGCHDRIPTRKLLDIWPPLPITIYYRPDDVTGEENVIAALEHRNRVTSITLVSSTTSVLERLCNMMQDDFPSLTSLGLELLVGQGQRLPFPKRFWAHLPLI